MILCVMISHFIINSYTKLTHKSAHKLIILIENKKLSSWSMFSFFCDLILSPSQIAKTSINQIRAQHNN